MMQGLQTRYKYTLIITLSWFLTSCMMGPDFHSPAAPTNTRYNSHALPKQLAGTKTAFNYTDDIPADWWHVFHSPAINTLVTQGIENSPNMASAQAALRQARELLYVQIGNSLIPAFNAGLSGERERFAGASLPGGSIPSTIFNTFNATVNVSYTLDIFGGARREIESLMANVDYQQYQLLATYLTLSTNIVTTAITVASLEEQIKATRELIQAEESQLTILQKQYQLGGVANTAVLSQKTLTNQTRATLPTLEKSLAQSRHALAVLIGKTPDRPLPKITLSKLTLPVKLPVSLPAALAKQRPDIRAAEALLHYASAQIGVATANLFPQVTINGTYGWTSSILPKLFSSNTKTWDILSQITQPIFHGGALLAARRSAIAAYEQSLAQYQQTVLQALQNVADTLRALDTDARAYRDQRSAERAAFENVSIASLQYNSGGVSYADLLLAQQQYQQARLTSIQAKTMQYTDVAALYQALGGGWWNRKG